MILYDMILYDMILYDILFYSILFYSILFYSIPLYSMIFLLRDYDILPEKELYLSLWVSLGLNEP